MSSYSIDQFIRHSAEKRVAGERFELESERMLRVDVDGSVWLKPGAVIAYRGEVSFERLPTLGASSMADAALRELAPLVRARGRGRLYCGRRGAHVRIIRLSGETLTVSTDELLAFESTLDCEPHIVAHGVGVMSGGLIAMRLSGHGALAVATHGEPLTLMVDADHPVSTDPHATIAWYGGLTPELKTDLSWRSLIKHGGQEPIQMLFRGAGFVVVQPYEDARRWTLDKAAIEKLSAAITV